LDNGFNQFSLLPNLPLNVIKYLVDNNENIWKIIKYPSADCLDKSNLTQAEKFNLIYNAQPISSDYRVFMDSASSDDLTDEQVSLLRVFPTNISPENQVLSIVHIGFEAICHSKINMLNTYQPRSLVLATEVISTLNGQNVNGIGVLQFNKGDMFKYNLYNNKNYKGYAFTLFTRVT
jgi:hypothetical protein